jgi:hypothetical protein
MNTNNNIEQEVLRNRFRRILQVMNISQGCQIKKFKKSEQVKIMVWFSEVLSM